jgi:hypothetical protein
MQHLPQGPEPRLQHYDCPLGQHAPRCRLIGDVRVLLNGVAIRILENQPPRPAANLHAAGAPGEAA